MIVKLGQKSSSASDDIAALANSLGIQKKKPQASLIQRILAPIMGLGSIPDALYRIEEGKNPLETYLGNIAGGIGTAITGDVPKELKTSEDLLKRAGILAGKDQSFGRAVAGIAGDIVLDPLTYVGIGPVAKGLKGVGAVDDVAKASFKKSYGSKAVKDIVEAVTKEAGETGIKKAAKIAKGAKLGTEFKTFTNALRTAPDMKALELGLPLMKKSRIIPQSKAGQTAITALEYGINPLGGMVKLAGKGVKAVVPELYDKALTGFYKNFNKGKYFEKLGHSLAREDFDRFVGELKTASYKAPRSSAAVKAKTLIEKLQKTNPEEYANIPKYVQMWGLDEGAIRKAYKDTPELIEEALRFSKPKDKEMRFIVKFIKKAYEAPQEKLVKMGVLSKVNPNYFPQQATGFTPEFIREKMSDSADFILGDSAIARKLAKAAPDKRFVSITDIKRLFKERFGAKAEERLASIEKYMGGSLMKRSYEDMIRGQAAGVVYNPNIVQAFEKQLVNDEHAWKVYEFAKRLPKVRDDLGQKVIFNGFDIDKLYNGKVPPHMKEIELGLGTAVKSQEKLLIKEVAKQRRAVLRNLASVQAKAKSLKREIRLVEKEIEKSGVGASVKAARLNSHKAMTGVLDAIIKTPAKASDEDLLKLTEIIKNYRRLGKENLSLLRVGRRLDKKLAGSYEKLAAREAELSELVTKQEAMSRTIALARKSIDDITKTNTFYAEPVTAELLKNYTSEILTDSGLKDVLQLYDTFSSFFKASVTQYGPLTISYNMRNMIGDFTNMIVGGWRNRDGALAKGWKAAGIMDNVDKYGWDKVARNAKYDKLLGTVGGKQVWATDLIDEGINSGLLGGSQMTEELGKRFGAVGDDAFQKYKNILGKATFARTMEKREIAMRLANLWDTAIKEDDLAVGTIAKVSSLDYGNLTTFEKQVMRRLIPFYSFMRQNLEYHLSNLTRRPGNYATFNKIVNNMQVAMGGELSEEERNALPEWMRTGLTLVAGREGDTATIITSLGLPITEIDRAFGTGPIGSPELATSTLGKLAAQANPLLRVPVEATTGYNFYFGEPIVSDQARQGERYSNMPGFLKDLLGYREVQRETRDGKRYTQKTVDPWAAYILGNVPIAGPLSTFWKRGTDFAGSLKEADGESLAMLAQLFSGIRTFNKDLTVAQEQELARREKEVEEELYRRGYGNVYKKFYLTKALGE